MPAFSYGNDPAKVARYRTFWSRSETRRPLVAFTLTGWFPLNDFAVCRSWAPGSELTPERIDPAEFLDDHIRMLREGETMDDDAIRGACPAQLAFPWLPGMLGAKVRILPGSVVGEERHVPLEEALEVRLDPANPWFRKYMQFGEALAERAQGAFPVSHAGEIGPTDLHALLRGSTESLLDPTDDPAATACLLEKLGVLFAELTQEFWKRVPLLEGGYFDAQYCLWAPGSIMRMQEDATATYSPRLYRRFVQPVDRAIARRFDNAFMHLHSTSMFLLDAFLEIAEIRCFEINRDVLGPPLAAMIPHFQRVQRAGRPLLIRGSFSPEEMRLLMDSLDPRGLMTLIIVQSMREVEPLRPLVGL
jgi:hypothetical protein